MAELGGLSVSLGEQLGRFAIKSRRRMEAVVKQSTLDVINTANRPRAKGGRMPVDTGNLRNSVVVVSGDAALPPVQARLTRAQRLAAASGGGGLAATQRITQFRGLADYRLGRGLKVQWSASYARVQEQRRLFLAVALRQWDRFVDRHARRAAQR